MAYVKTEWTHGVTPLDETNMNNLETQYDEAIADLVTHTADVDAHHGVNRFSGLEANIPAVTQMKEGAIYLPLDAPYVYTLTGGAWIKSFNEDYFNYPNATVGDFQSNAATGTIAYNVASINDNSQVSTEAYDQVIGRYGEVNFGKVVKINQWRQYGDAANLEDGTWKIQYKDVNGAWQNWVTGIPTRAAESWSVFSVESEVITRYIRLVITAVDTQGHSRINELEVIHT